MDQHLGDEGVTLEDGDTVIGKHEETDRQRAIGATFRAERRSGGQPSLAV